MDRRKFIGAVGVLAVGTVLPAGDIVPTAEGLTEYEQACRDWVRGGGLYVTGVDPYHMDVATYDVAGECWVYSRSAALEESDRQIVAHYKSG